jgi:putative ABC transport system substrate-binding protein
MSAMEAKRTVGGGGRHSRTDPFQKADLCGYDTLFQPQEVSMKRRQFITLLGGAATWPLAARAQQRATPVVGYLSGRNAETDALVLPAFRQGLNMHGYIEGRNLTIEYRYAAGQIDRFPSLIADLVKRPVAAIVVVGSEGGQGVSMLKAATTTIPIVFNAGNDPVAMGYVASLGRPGGNVTGVTSFFSLLGPKRLSLLGDLAPHAATIAILTNPTGTGAELIDLLDAARTIGLEVKVLNASTADELATALASLPQIGADALLVTTSPFFFVRADEIIAYAARQALPALYFRREFAAVGGLMSYGSDPNDSYRIIGDYTGRILNGANPGDLPVQQPTKFELVINLRTARALGLTVPLPLLGTADEVIE